MITVSNRLRMRPESITQEMFSMSLSVSVQNMRAFAPVDDVLAELPAAHATLTGHTGLGNDYLGWLALPKTIELSLIHI